MTTTYELQQSVGDIKPFVTYIDITDKKYFINIEAQIREKFARWEVENMLPAAKMVMGRAEIPNLALKEYPVEGYYYKSPELKQLFQLVRNFQQNKEIYLKLHDDDMLKRLRNVYDSDLFGTPPVTGYPWPDSPLKRRWDLLTHVMQTPAFDDGRNYPWTIPSVMEAVQKKKKGMVNLVELAAAIGEPELLCAAAETNCLGRMYACVSGSYCLSASFNKTEYRWLVSSEVEQLGSKIVESYNKVMDANSIQHVNNSVLIAPHEYNASTMSWTEMEVPRVAHLGYVMAKDENYFWIVDYDHQVYDIYTREFLTTEKYPMQRTKIMNEIKRT